MVIGPVSCIPDELLRPTALICFGEDRLEWLRALEEANLPHPTHEYRGILAGCNADVMTVLAPFGTASAEALMWELLRGATKPERVVLVGTAGALPGFTGPTGDPLVASPATPVYASIDDHVAREPTLHAECPRAATISTDRFYGMSPLVHGPFPAEPGLVQAWSKWRTEDGIIDMETAAFYGACERFGPPELEYVCIRVVANRVDDLSELPAASQAALHRAVGAAQLLL